MTLSDAYGAFVIIGIVGIATLVGERAYITTADLFQSLNFCLLTVLTLHLSPS